MEGPINSWQICSKKSQKTASFIPFLQRNGTGEHGHRLYTSPRIFPSVNSTGNWSLGCTFSPFFFLLYVLKDVASLLASMRFFSSYEIGQYDYNRPSRAGEYIYTLRTAGWQKSGLIQNLQAFSHLSCDVITCTCVGVDDTFWPERRVDLGHIFCFCCSITASVSCSECAVFSQFIVSAVYQELRLKRQM